MEPPRNSTVTVDAAVPHSAFRISGKLDRDPRRHRLRTLGTLNESLPEDTIPPLAGSIDEIDALNLPPVLRASQPARRRASLSSRPLRPSLSEKSPRAARRWPSTGSPATAPESRFESCPHRILVVRSLPFRLRGLYDRCSPDSRRLAASPKSAASGQYPTSKHMRA